MNKRENLFRGKTFGNGEWVEGYLSWENQISFKVSEGKNFLEIKTCLVIPETVGQYTGLTDKNGKKIFEGDILSTGNPDEYFGVVKWDDDIMDLAVSFGGIFESFKSLIFLDNIALEVIGNVYDNPELLEVQI